MNPTFETERLRVGGWHDARLPADAGLIAAVRAMLTPATTRELPTEWRGEYDERRARAWIAERDEESPPRIVLDAESGEPVGLLFLFEVAGENPGENPGDGTDVRLGYLLAEAAWGRGLGSELVAGFVAWCRGQPAIRSITAGVAADSPASARLLTKSGFATVGETGDGAQLFRLLLAL